MEIPPEIMDLIDSEEELEEFKQLLEIEQLPTREYEMDDTPIRKARPVTPPEAMSSLEGGEVDVDMTKYYYGMVGLSLLGAGLAGATGYLWRKVKQNNESIEALSEYASRLINHTDCGREAFETFLEEENLEAPVNWSETEKQKQQS